MPEIAQRIALIVIHGWGGTLLETAGSIAGLLQVEVLRKDGAFWVPRRNAVLLRHLLSEPSEDARVTALRQLVISRFLRGPSVPSSLTKERLQADYSRFSEERLRQMFPSFGFPLSPTARLRRAEQLQQEAEVELAPVLEAIEQLLCAVQAGHVESESESAVRSYLESVFPAPSPSGAFLPFLEHLRGMHETGGDLDTVASAVLYAQGLRSEALRAGREFRYGRDFRFVFVNYHESLRRLESCAPAGLYLADLPVGAFPELAQDIRYLHEAGVGTVCLEDHHPYLPEQREAFEKLCREGILGRVALSGPLQGTEQPEEEQKCAADMVYEIHIQGTPADHAGARQLREAAHGEDFVRGRTPLGILLTNLIKGGICKTELAQILLDSMGQDDAMQRLEERGWADLPALWKQEMDATAEQLAHNAYCISLDDETRIMVVLAVHAEAGLPVFPTGKAIETIARRFPDAHYAFYCFGSSLMVARRLDQTNTVLNLGSLMSQIGTAADGGHAGAAVCRPDANPDYPVRLLSHVSASNFDRFSNYLAGRLRSAGLAVAGISDCSQAAPIQRQGGGGKRLLLVLGIAFLLGLLLITFFPAFRPDSVRNSNEMFFPHISSEDELSATEGDTE